MTYAELFKSPNPIMEQPKPDIETKVAILLPGEGWLDPKTSVRSGYLFNGKPLHKYSTFTVRMNQGYHELLSGE